MFAKDFIKNQSIFGIHIYLYKCFNESFRKEKKFKIKLHVCNNRIALLMLLYLYFICDPSPYLVHMFTNNDTKCVRSAQKIEHEYLINCYNCKNYIKFNCCFNLKFKARVYRIYELYTLPRKDVGGIAGFIFGAEANVMLPFHL